MVSYIRVRGACLQRRVAEFRGGDEEFMASAVGSAHARLLLTRNIVHRTILKHNSKLQATKIHPQNKHRA
jgi:hypothetical protein